MNIGRRVISFANSSVIIEWSGSLAGGAIDFLFSHTLPGPATPHVTFRVGSGFTTGHTVIYRDGALIYEGDSEAGWMHTLLEETCYQLVATSWGGLVFHAACLAPKDSPNRGILVPGASGCGKTTLALWLGSRGFEFLSDELVYVPEGTRELRPLTRPLNLKKGTRAILARLVGSEKQAAHTVSGPEIDLVSPALLQPAPQGLQPPLGLILLPRYTPGGAFELRRLAKAEAGLALMQHLINARNLPGYGLPQVAQLARETPAYAVSYDQIEPLAALLLAVQDYDILGARFAQAP